MNEIRLVDTTQDVKPVLDWLADLPVLGVDVEREDVNRYHLTPALIQVGGNGKVAIFDPIMLTDPKDWRLIAKFIQRRTTILHAMENDLPPLEKLGIIPKALHDTSLAAAFLGYPLGLSDLLKQELDIELTDNKLAMQQAPWERRPLTQEEIEYAAGDVADLPALLRKLTDELREKRRYEWYREELRYRRAQPGPRERRSWHKVKGVGKLNDSQRARAVVLWETREAIASEHDVAPNLVIPDKGIIGLADKPVSKKQALKQAGMPHKAIRLYGDEMVEAIKESQQATPVPGAQPQNYPSVAERELIEELKAARSEIAEETGLAAGFLLPSKQISKAILSYPRNQEELYMALDVRKWQWRLIQERFTQIAITDGGLQRTLVASQEEKEHRLQDVDQLEPSQDSSGFALHGPGTTRRNGRYVRGKHAGRNRVGRAGKSRVRTGRSTQTAAQTQPTPTDIPVPVQRADGLVDIGLSPKYLQQLAVAREHTPELPTTKVPNNRIIATPLIVDKHRPKTGPTGSLQYLP